jgi:hypothetical protein
MRTLIALLALAFPAAASAQTSGSYGQLKLAIVGNQVSGVFSEGRIGNGDEAAPQFSCAFLLRGTMSGNRAIVRTWYPGEAPIKGSLQINGTDVSLMMQENHGGCMMTSGDMVDQPFTTDLVTAGKGWTGVALVTSARAVLRKAPGAVAKAPYIVDGDAVGILERRPGWLRVAYLGEKTVTGWVRASEVTVAE